MARMGPLLSNVLQRIQNTSAGAMAVERLSLAAHVGGSETGDRLPLVLQIPPVAPRDGETWPEFKERVRQELEPMAAVMGPDTKLSYASGALSLTAPVEQAAAMAENERFALVELDPVVKPTLMDDAILDVNVAGFSAPGGPFTGAGVRVAVLDSGIDLQHPFLNVTASVSTCGEDVAIPGRHGTHCAGSIASLDTAFRGVAPGVDLLNVKVLRSDGTGQHTNITKGVDEALDLEAHVLSMSLGFNHLPSWSDRGHGWACPTGACPLCVAVNNAVAFGAVAVVAAGNEHNRAQALRTAGFGAMFDTEIACPGQATGAITVGAITKRTFLPAAFSSRGPTAFGSAKPDLAGPGVNVMSTVPVPRTANGTPVANPARVSIFDRESGTSMATPVVAGAVALLIEARRAAGLPVSPAAIRSALMTGAVTPIGGQPATVVGAGRLELR